MKPKSCAACCLGVATPFLLFSVFVTAAEPETSDSIREKLKARDATFVNARFVGDFQVERRLSDNAPLSESAEHVECTFDNESRCYLEVHRSTALGGQWFKESGQIFSADRGGSREMVGLVPQSDRPRTPIEFAGVVRAGQAVPMCVSPLVAFDLNTYSPLQRLKNVAFRVERSERVGDVDAIKISWSTLIKRDNTERKGAYWLAPAFGYAPVQYRDWQRQAGATEWVLLSSALKTGFQEYAGLWLPGQVEITHYRYDPDRRDTELISRVAGKLSNWQVNRPLAPDALELRFPAGTLVNDRVQRRKYVVKEANEQGSPPAVQNARRVLNQSAPVVHRPQNRLPRLPVGIAAACVGAGLLVLIVARWIRGDIQTAKTP